MLWPSFTVDGQVEFCSGAMARGRKMLLINSARVAGVCVLIAGTLFLGGCQSSADFARMNAEYDRKRCEDYGFKSGSEAFAKCRYDLDQRRDDDRTAMFSRSMGPQVYMPPPGPCWNTAWGWRCESW